MKSCDLRVWTTETSAWAAAVAWRALDADIFGEDMVVLAVSMIQVTA